MSVKKLNTALVSNVFKKTKKNIKNRLHPALKNKIKNKKIDKKLPTLSVVVPAYNVEEYLSDCLYSIISQSYSNLEVIVVIDGSPDDSYKIAKEFSKWDKRIKVIYKENGGLGAARNTGLEYVKGDYLTFCDSDDIIPRGSYKKMMDTLIESGSDFVVGCAARKKNGKITAPKWAQKAHAIDKIGTSIQEFPIILADVIANNKIFKTNFFVKNIIKFPENIKYEDQEPILKGYVAARKFDVINDITYNWIVREDGTSISQQLSNIDTFKDRATVIKRVFNNLESHGDHNLVLQYAVNQLTLNLPQHFELLPRMDEYYWTTFRNTILDIMSHINEDEIVGRVSMYVASIVHAIISDSSEDVEKLVTSRELHGTSYYTEIKNKQVFVYPEYINDLKNPLPENLRVLSESNIEIISKLLTVRHNEDKVTLSGIAYSPQLKPDESRFFATLITPKGTIELPVKYNKKVEPYYIPGERYHNCDSIGFEIDINKLIIEKLSEGKYGIGIELSSGDVTAKGVIQSIHPNSPAAFSSPICIENENITAFGFALSDFNSDGEPGLTLKTYSRPVLRKVTYKKDSTDLDIFVPNTLNDTVSSIKVIDRNNKKIVYKTHTSFNNIKLNIKSINKVGKYKLLIEDKKGKDHKIITSLQSLEGQNYVSNRANLQCILSESSRFESAISVQNRVIFIEDCEFDAKQGVLSVLGYYKNRNSDNLNLIFKGSDATIYRAKKIEINKDKFKAQFDLRAEKNISVPQFRGALYIRSRNGNEKIVKTNYKFRQHLPMEFESSIEIVKISRTRNSSGFWMNTYAPLSINERSRYGQNLLLEKYTDLVEGDSLENAALFESFNCNKVDDSPLYISQHLQENQKEIKLYWSVKDRSIKVPEGMIPLVQYSEEWYKKLATSKYLINNSHFSSVFKKAKSQIYIQTWHGTPLKSIEYDVPMTSLGWGYRERMKQSKYWDYLLAQNEFSKKVFPRAFNYNGDIVTKGYPRNDMLASRIDKAQIDTIKNKIGISKPGKVILYAPTWRDNKKGSNKHYNFVSFLDTDKILKKFPSSTLLIRGHINTAKNKAIFKNKSIINVTDYPELNDLIIASDCLITDYSSIMFDYAVTQKPIYYLAPDIDEYTSSLRGVYIDLSSIAPGPILNSTEELIDSMHAGQNKFDKKYKEFNEKYSPYDDGHAAERIVNDLLIK